MRKALIPAELKTMQRLCSKLRSLAAVHSSARPQLFPAPFFSRLLHSATNLLHKPLTSTVISPNFNPNFTTFLTSQIALPGCASFLPLSFMQVRYVTLKQRKRHAKVRRPSSPIVSKVKKIKMKTYSSYKGRFRTMNDGQIRRWREGTRHNAHLKSKKAKRRLRQPSTVPLAYAKVMKKLNFSAHY